MTINWRLTKRRERKPKLDRQTKKKTVQLKQFLKRVFDWKVIASDCLCLNHQNKIEKSVRKSKRIWISIEMINLFFIRFFFLLNNNEFHLWIIYSLKSVSLKSESNKKECDATIIRVQVLLGWKDRLQITISHANPLERSFNWEKR